MIKIVTNMKLNILYQSACGIILALSFIPLSTYANEVDELYAELEVIFSQPNGSNILKEKASRISDELAIAILDDNLERVEKAALLMRYVQPAPSWDTIVYNLMTSDNEVSVYAGLSILDVHGILGDATKDQLPNLIADPSSTEVLSAAARIAGRASLTEVIPLLRKELWSDDIERNTAAVRGLIEFGPNASSLVPDLERKRRQISEKSGGAAEKENNLSYIPRADKTEALKDLIEKAIIKLTPVSIEAGNDFVEHMEQRIETTRPQTAEPAIEESAEVFVTEPIEEYVEPASNWWLWLVGMVVVVGGILKVCRKK